MGILSDIIKESAYLFENNVSSDEFNNHHTIPLTVKNEIERKINESRDRRSKNKNRKNVDDVCLLLSRIDLNHTKLVFKEFHDNYNQIFIAGDLLPTEVLGKLMHEILRDDYLMCNKKGESNNGSNGNGYRKKIRIVKFFFYASKFNGLNYSDKEIKKIDEKLNWKCTSPVKLLELFKMTAGDIVYYLEENFLYPGYYRFYEVWKMLSENGHRKGRRGANKYHQKFADNRI